MGLQWSGMSKVRHPLLQEAAFLRFQAQARSELLPTDGPIKIRNDDNNASSDEDNQANDLEEDANHFTNSDGERVLPRHRPHAYDAWIRWNLIQEDLFLPIEKSPCLGKRGCS